MAKKIYLSPSNQYANVYSYGNTNEMIQCNRIAAHAENALKRCGFDVKKAPQGQDMNVSIRESNNWGADLHVPIHTNAYNGNVTGGTLVMLYDDSAENIKAGKAILNAIAPISPGSDYTLRYRPELTELNSTRCTSVYLEVEFHDTKQGAKWIVNNTETIGEALAKGICDYYGVKYVTPIIPTPNVEEMRKGDRGLDVLCFKYLIQIADDMGIINYGMTLGNEIFAKGTESSVKELQNLLNLKITGVVDSKLVDELYLLIAKNYPVMGDVNSDGKVDVKDVTALQKEIAGIEE